MYTRTIQKIVSFRIRSRYTQTPTPNAAAHEHLDAGHGLHLPLRIHLLSWTAHQPDVRRLDLSTRVWAAYAYMVYVVRVLIMFIFIYI